MSRSKPACVCRKCGMDHDAPPNPAWRHSPPSKPGRIRVEVLRNGQVVGHKIVEVVEVDAYAIRDFLPAPDPRA